MSKLVFFVCFFIVLGYCNCKLIPLTEEEIEDGFTIVLPRQGKNSLLQCYLEIAKNGETKSDFYPAFDIKKGNKNRDGIEYVPNYYQTGNNDSCTFRIYPKTLDQISDIFQMRYWNIILKNRNQDANIKWRLPEEIAIETLFYMNSWSWWKEQHVNTLKLQLSNPLIPWNQVLASDLEYLYVERKIKQALTEEEMEDGFTIVLPRQEKYSSLQCYLEIAKNNDTKSNFYPVMDLKSMDKNLDGMEYVHNYYQTGNDDSCTFRVYPNILKEFYDLFQMRYWNITMMNRKKGSIKWRIPEQLVVQTSLFYMNSWSWWTEQHVNTLILKFPNPLTPWKLAGDFEYLYVDKKAENAFTIVLPQEKEFRSLVCFLKIAVNATTTEEFIGDGKNIRDKNKHHDGMEYVPNYYNFGKNDSCTFRIYPEILDKLSNGHDKYQMRYWEIVTFVDKGTTVEEKKFLFYMKSWWSWKKDNHVNTLELKEGILSNYATCMYRYI